MCCGGLEKYYFRNIGTVQREETHSTILYGFNWSSQLLGLLTGIFMNQEQRR